MYTATTRTWVAAALAGLVLGTAACGVSKIPTEPVPVPVDDPPPQVVPIRRLTNAEYLASVTDLFAGTTLPDLTFVPDNKILGFLNLSSSQTSSLVRMEQYESAGQAIARVVAADPTALTGCDAATSSELACAEPYLHALGKRAYRRPLSATEKQALTALLMRNEGTVDYPTRLGLAIQGVLLSPKFLFRAEFGDSTAADTGTAGVKPLTPWELATRLSFLINGSLPDAELAAAADTGLLSTPAEVRAQADRLLALPRSQAHLVDFHQMWLGIESINALSKSQTDFPTFTPELTFYMGQETRRFLQNVLFTQAGSFADLFTGGYTFANAQLAAFYGVPAPATDWDRVELDPTRRSGLLTQASLLATMAKEDRTDPVRRGKFVLERLLCRNVIPPPPAAVAQFKPLDLSKTARQQFESHNQISPACGACHKTLDPLGLPFEHYDASGQWRDDDRGMTIDVTGKVDRIGPDGKVAESIPFDGIPGLASVLVDLPDSRTCYVAQWFRFASGRLNNDSDKNFLDWLSAKFTRDTKIVDMVAELVQSNSFRNVRSAP